MVDRTLYTQHCCVYSVLSTIISPFFPGHRVLVLPSLLLSIWCSVHHYFPLLSWSSCFGFAQSFVVYIVYCPPLFLPSFLVIVFCCCSVFCCLYSVLSTIISPFFPGHRVLVLLSLLLSIWCAVHHYFPLLSWSLCVCVAQSFVVYIHNKRLSNTKTRWPGKKGKIMVDRTLYRQQKTEQHQNTMTRKEGGNNGGQNTI
jgi:hypothetical protein